ncbi:hypothetical protein HDU76_003056 [Blyttiomyces sp. JEL0837]|nr:hypothetical protein HDU76_003056 [Blyttiomyces sp. JEL0837]
MTTYNLRRSITDSRLIEVLDQNDSSVVLNVTVEPSDITLFVANFTITSPWDNSIQMNFRLSSDLKKCAIYPTKTSIEPIVINIYDSFKTDSLGAFKHNGQSYLWNKPDTENQGTGDSTHPYSNNVSTSTTIPSSKTCFLLCNDSTIARASLSTNVFIRGYNPKTGNSPVFAEFEWIAGKLGQNQPSLGMLALLIGSMFGVYGAKDPNMKKEAKKMVPGSASGAGNRAEVSEVAAAGCGCSIM